MGHTHDGKKFFGRNNKYHKTKADHQLSESFYFIKIYVLIELWIFFCSILSDVFCQKSVISSITAVPPIQNALKNKAGGHNYLRTLWLEFLRVFTLSLEFPGNIKLHSWSLLLSNGNSAPGNSAWFFWSPLVEIPRYSYWPCNIIPN